MTAAQAYENIRNRKTVSVQTLGYTYRGELITMIWHDRPWYIIVTVSGSYRVGSNEQIDTPQ